MVISLNFHQTEEFGFPQGSYGGGTGLSLCEKDDRLMLAFLTQQPGVDTLYLLNPCNGDVIEQYVTPLGIPQISGIGWDPINNWLYFGSGYETHERVVAFNPNSEAIVRLMVLPNADTMEFASGFATNGYFMVRSQYSKMEIRAMNGVFLADREYPGRNIRGVSASPNGWTFIDGASNDIVVTDPFGREVAVAQAPGPVNTDATAGAHALAFDYITFPTNDPVAQNCTPYGSGTAGHGEIPPPQPGTPFDPTQPWSPPPWLFQHKIYIANQTSQRIYVGYLTQTP